MNVAVVNCWFITNTCTIAVFTSAFPPCAVTCWDLLALLFFWFFSPRWRHNCCTVVTSADTSQMVGADTKPPLHMCHQGVALSYRGTKPAKSHEVPKLRAFRLEIQQLLDGAACTFSLNWHQQQSCRNAAGEITWFYLA